MKNYYAFLPGVYFIRSRLRTKHEVISWILINPVVILMFSWPVSEISVAGFCIAFVLSFIAWQSTYEIGYIVNDMLTTKSEQSPTLRLSQGERDYFEENFSRIVFGKILVTLLALAGVLYLDSMANTTLHVELFVIATLGALLAFWIHNKVRSRANIITYLFLSSFKYLSIPLLFYAATDIYLFILTIILSFPLLRTLEHACKVKYGFSWLASFFGSFDRFRPKYYGVVTLLALGLAVWDGSPELRIWLAISAYFLVVRFVGFLASRRLKRSLPESYRWDS
ncbi:MAG: hypothetical protein WDZ30_07765 [Cellvibrionaceae bacterium]